ncbi:MAG TPA: hemolysin family protein [Chitinophagaceae bacterium]|jgi:CBS domain containing-hemolysin-like protein|nr:hemolysin family protein [Chitinophagaceae bacterium]
MNVIVIIGIVLAILFLAFYAGIEVAYITANRLNIELKKKQGSSSGILLSRLFEEPSRFIGIVIIGYYFFLTLFVLLVSTFWNILINYWPITASAKVPVRLVLEILLSVISVLFIGDFIPRAIFKARADSKLYFAARTGLLGASDRFWAPVARLFLNTSLWILDIFFNIRIDKKKELFSRADLEHFYQSGSEGKDETHDLNTDLFEAAMMLPNIRIRECLVPRKEIEGIDLHAGIEDLRQKMVATRLSKIVVYDGNIDHIVGYVHQLELFRNASSIQEILLPIPAVPESMTVTDLINKFTRDRKSIAWVVDEFGGTAGIVTMEDLLEEIFGEIRDEYDVEEFEEKKISEKEFILSGRLELDYLREKYGFEFPENDSETLSGFIIHQHETIPRLKDRIIINDYEFEVLNVSDTRIELVRLKILR